MTHSIPRESADPPATRHGVTQESVAGASDDRAHTPDEGPDAGRETASRLDRLLRFGIRIRIQAGTEPDPQSCIPVFHRWIRERALDGLLIDVADYAHLVDGPRVLLVGHEGNLSLDYSPDSGDGRVGLLYSGKRPVGATFPARLARVTRIVIHAAHLLESEATLDIRPRFETHALQFVGNDRLVVPTADSDAGIALVRPYLAALAATLYPETADKTEITAVQTQKSRFRVSLTSGQTPSLRTLLDRLS